MIAFLSLQFEDEPTAEDVEAVRALARRITTDRESIEIKPHPAKPRWLEAEFAMRDMRQIDAVDVIDGALEFGTARSIDTMIGFSTPNRPPRKRSRRSTS